MPIPSSTLLRSYASTLQRINVFPCPTPPPFVKNRPCAAHLALLFAQPQDSLSSVPPYSAIKLAPRARPGFQIRNSRIVKSPLSSAANKHCQPPNTTPTLHYSSLRASVFTTLR